MATFSAHDMKRLVEEMPKTAAPEHGGSDSTRMAALAEATSGQGGGRAISPIVLGGVVRLAEFVLVAATGLLVHHFYVEPPIGTEFQ